MDGNKEEGSSSEDRQPIPTAHKIGESSGQAEKALQVVTVVTMFKQLMENPRFMEFIQSSSIAHQVQGSFGMPGTVFRAMQGMVPNPIVATDACQDMKIYEKSPESSSFSKMLPCLRPVEATNALDTAKSAIKNLISQMNEAIDLVNGREELMKLQYANGSFGITLKHFCDPFGPPPDYLEAKCLPNQSNFSTFATVSFNLPFSRSLWQWANMHYMSTFHKMQDYEQYQCAEDVVFHCFESNTPIPSSYYTQFIISISAAKEVIKLLPVLYGIMTCAFIKKAFQDLTSNHCSSIEAALNTLWIAFAAASVAMMSVQVMWIAIRKHLTVRKDFKLQFMYSPFG
ncbi:hypothetical protein L7F22_021144 [Adiantum nelumboides]|nr:hypothetical protein [Adiantum nelumboides]